MNLLKCLKLECFQKEVKVHANGKNITSTIIFQLENVFIKYYGCVKDKQERGEIKNCGLYTDKIIKLKCNIM